MKAKNGKGNLVMYYWAKLAYLTKLARRRSPEKCNLMEGGTMEKMKTNSSLMLICISGLSIFVTILTFIAYHATTPKQIPRSSIDQYQWIVTESLAIEGRKILIINWMKTANPRWDYVQEEVLKVNQRIQKYNETLANYKNKYEWQIQPGGPPEKIELMEIPKPEDPLSTIN